MYLGVGWHKIVVVRWFCVSGQEEVGWVTHRVLCTWWLLGLAVKGPWLGLDGPILTLAT